MYICVSGNQHLQTSGSPEVLTICLSSNSSAQIYLHCAVNKSSIISPIIYIVQYYKTPSKLTLFQTVSSIINAGMQIYNQVLSVSRIMNHPEPLCSRTALLGHVLNQYLFSHNYWNTQTPSEPSGDSDRKQNTIISWEGPLYTLETKESKTWSNLIFSC